MVCEGAVGANGAATGESFKHILSTESHTADATSVTIVPYTQGNPWRSVSSRESLSECSECGALRLHGCRCKARCAAHSQRYAHASQRRKCAVQAQYVGRITKISERDREGHSDRLLNGV